MTRAEQIRDRLTQRFDVSFIDVENESHLHHSGKGADSHFKITLVSKDFAEQGLLSRHRAVQKTITDIIQGIHALGLHTYTPDEWLAREQNIPASSTCAGA
jgi:BolA protein